MRLRIYPYMMGSKSSKALAIALDCKQIKHEGSKFVAKEEDVVINWGCSQLPKNVTGGRIINDPEVVANATNKLRFFETVRDKGVRTPEWTTDRDQARAWQQDGKTVVVRNKLTGHSGEGIVICEPGVDIPQAPLYTMYVPKKAEYRVHFAFGKPIDIQKKIRDPNKEPKDWKVRNHDNGFIYVRNGVQEATPDDVWAQAAAAVRECGLDFGAVDILWNDKQGRAYVLEINSAPGLEGQTVDSYVKAIKEHLEEQAA